MPITTTSLRAVIVAAYIVQTAVLARAFRKASRRFDNVIERRDAG